MHNSNTVITTSDQCSNCPIHVLSFHYNILGVSFHAKWRKKVKYFVPELLAWLIMETLEMMEGEIQEGIKIIR